MPTKKINRNRRVASAAAKLLAQAGGKHRNMKYLMNNKTKNRNRRNTKKYKKIISFIY